MVLHPQRPAVYKIVRITVSMSDKRKHNHPYTFLNIRSKYLCMDSYKSVQELNSRISYALTQEWGAVILSNYFLYRNEEATEDFLLSLEVLIPTEYQSPANNLWQLFLSNLPEYTENFSSICKQVTKPFLDQKKQYLSKSVMLEDLLPETRERHN